MSYVNVKPSDTEYRKITANEARDNADSANNTVSGKDEKEELNTIYGMIHKASNNGEHSIKVGVHYENVLNVLNSDGYNITVDKIAKQDAVMQMFPRNVALVTIRW